MQLLKRAAFKLPFFLIFYCKLKSLKSEQMKKIQNSIMALLMLFGAMSLFAQKSTYFNGTYLMNYGNQRMEIIPDGGMYYHVKFTGDCNASTRKGRVDNGLLMIPMGSGNSNFIMISWQGNKLNVEVKGTNHMRKVCGGYSIEGLYSLKKNTNTGGSGVYGGSGGSGVYNGNKIDVNFLKGWKALKAYDELKGLGFYEQKSFSSRGKTYRVWYNRKKRQCVKTLSQKEKITQVMESNRCKH